MHKTCIATVCLSGSLSEKLVAIANAGFDYVEIFEDDILRFPGSIQDVSDLCSSLNLQVAMFQPFRDLDGSKTREEFAASLERLEQKFGWMDVLKTDLILVVSNCNPDAVGDWEQMIQDLREASELAARSNKRIAYEALAWGTHVNLWSQSWDIVKAVNHPNFGICLDTFHIFSRNDSITEISSLDKEKIFMVQLADAPILDMNILEYSRHHRNLPLQGAMPVVEFMKSLAKTGFDGILSLEVFSDNFRASSPEDTARDSMGSLLLLQEEVYGKQTANFPRSLGIEFVEFAAGTFEELMGLERFFGRMGFTKRGSHKSKNVSWYNNGKVSFVLNAEKECYASQFHATHGVSICAMAIRVDDAVSAIKRAKEFGYNIITSSKLGLEEANIAAVQAPDGILVYLVDDDSFWGKDFWSTGLSPLENQLYSNIDHLIQAIKPETLDSFVLFYKAIFGMDLKTQNDIPDFYGLIKSYSMENRGSDFRMSFHTSHSSKTNCGRLIQKASGPVVQCLAIGTKDIFGTMSHLRQTPIDGAVDPFCTIPPNYYPDLAARHKLSPEFVDRLQSMKILFDRDANGKFLHSFTRSFSDRFYIQIVQRVDGYEGLGTVNLGQQMAVLHDVRLKVAEGSKPLRGRAADLEIVEKRALRPWDSANLGVSILESTPRSILEANKRKWGISGDGGNVRVLIDTYLV